MTETPRPIEPRDIRPGDRICVAWSSDGIDRTHALTVAEVDLGSMLAKAAVSGQWVTLTAAGRATVTLLDRPTPDRPVGSRWLDPETGAEYVRRDDGDYSRYRAGSRRAGDACLVEGFDDEITRLTPIPAFDPATLWPRAVVATVCRASTVDHESSRYYQCDRVQDHDGPHVEHVDAEARYLWGDPR